MSKLLVASSLMLASSMASAALPPQWDQVAKFKTVLSAPEVVTNLGAGLVKAVTQTKDYEFAVEFDKYRCTYLVTLKVVPPKGGMVGPAEYAVADISQPTCERP